MQVLIADQTNNLAIALVRILFGCVMAAIGIWTLWQAIRGSGSKKEKSETPSEPEDGPSA